MQTRSCSSQPQDDLQCFMHPSVHTLVSSVFAGLTEETVHAFGGQVIKDCHFCLTLLESPCWGKPAAVFEDTQLLRGPRSEELRLSTHNWHQLTCRVNEPPCQQLLQPQTSLQLTEAQTATFTPTSG